MLGYYSQPVRWLTKVDLLLCLFCRDKVGNHLTLKSVSWAVGHNLL